MKKLTSVFFAFCMILSFSVAVTGCEDNRRNQPGEAINEGVNDVKRGAEDTTEKNDNAISEGASDVKRSAEDATD